MQFTVHISDKVIQEYRKAYETGNSDWDSNQLALKESLANQIGQELAEHLVPDQEIVFYSVEGNKDTVVIDM